MGQGREESAVRDLLREHAESSRPARHGDLYRLDNGETILVGNHGGDWRAWKNTLAELRRLLGRSEEDPVSETVKAEAKPLSERDRLAALGAHIERKRRVIAEDVAEVTLGVEAIVKALGIHLEPGASVELLDPDGGSLLASTVLLRVTQIREESY